MEAKKFLELYPLHWGIESMYRKLKNRLETESFNSMKPASIRQEFSAAIYLSNLASIVKRNADSVIVSSFDNKHNYQSSRSYILNRIKCNILLLLRSSASVCSNKIFQITEEASKIRSSVRPNRKFDRYRKHKRRRYYSHMKSCI